MCDQQDPDDTTTCTQEQLNTAADILTDAVQECYKQQANDLAILNTLAHWLCYLAAHNEFSTADMFRLLAVHLDSAAALQESLEEDPIIEFKPSEDIN